MVFPQEIYNLIVDQVVTGDDNFSALFACANASRVLLYPAYTLLFSHIRLTISDQDVPNVRDFISLLRNSLRSPDISIASYIRTFELIVLKSLLCKVHMVFPDSELWRVLNSFTRVEHLKVSSPDFRLSFKTH